MLKGANVFPCSKFSKICKSKGGLTKHTNSKHGDTVKSIVDTTKEYIIAEKLYGDEIDCVVKNISARKLEEEVSNEFISARTRGGLVTPCEDTVRNLHEAEICFRKEVNKTDIIRNILWMQPAFRLSTSPLLQENIVLSSGVNPSCDMNKLCLENIVKMFLKVGSFSYTKDYATQYKIKEKQGRKKALRKDLKQSLEV